MFDNEFCFCFILHNFSVYKLGFSYVQKITQLKLGNSTVQINKRIFVVKNRSFAAVSKGTLLKEKSIE